LTLAAPRHQEQNAYCERTWQTVRNIAFSMMNFARVGQQYTHFALQYAVDHIFPALPWTNLQVSGRPSTPYELSEGKKPRISHLRTLFCPCIVKKDSVRQNGHLQRTNNLPQRGIRGVFIGFPSDQAGSLVYIPSTRQIIVSADVAYDETFSSAIAYTEKPFHDEMTL
ncbi:MAG: hypothetical protein ACRDL7_16160, partial [Gaiellaceae bacterium]